MWYTQVRFKENKLKGFSVLLDEANTKKLTKRQRKDSETGILECFEKHFQKHYLEKSQSKSKNWIIEENFE
jgi:hypothetical protein